MSSATRAVLLWGVIGVTVAGCQAPTDADDKGVPAVVGEWCGLAQAATVSRTSGRPIVSVPQNRTTYRDVRRADGVVVRQEVRSCGSKSCIFDASQLGLPDGDLIAACLVMP